MNRLFLKLALMTVLVVPLARAIPFELTNGFEDEDLRVILFQPGPTQKEVMLDPGETKTVEMPGTNKNQLDITVLPGRYPKIMKNVQDSFQISDRYAARTQCMRIARAGQSWLDCTSMRPDLVGKTKFKIVPRADGHSDLQAKD